jgi:hypothetical protein
MIITLEVVDNRSIMQHINDSELSRKISNIYTNHPYYHCDLSYAYKTEREGENRDATLKTHSQCHLLALRQHACPDSMQIYLNTPLHLDLIIQNTTPSIPLETCSTTSDRTEGGGL